MSNNDEYPLFTELNVPNADETKESFIPLMPFGDLSKYVNYESSGDESFEEMNTNDEYADTSPLEMELKSEVLKLSHQNHSIEQPQIESHLNDIKAEIMRSSNEQQNQLLVKSVEAQIDPTVLDTVIKKCIDDTMKKFSQMYELRPKEKRPLHKESSKQKRQHGGYGSSNRAHGTKRGKSDGIQPKFEGMASRSSTLFDEFSTVSPKFKHLSE